MADSQKDFTDSALKCKLNSPREQLPGNTLSPPPSANAGTEFCTIAIDGQMNESGHLAISSSDGHADVSCEVDTCDVSFNTVIR